MDIRRSDTEFRVESEGGQVDAFDTYNKAWAQMSTYIASDADAHGESEARSSGVLNPYGYAISVVRDGENITDQWSFSHPHHPLTARN